MIPKDKKIKIYTTVKGRESNLFESMCGKKSAGWIDKITKTNKHNLWSVGYQHKKTTPESSICILQKFVTILTAGWYRPNCRCNSNNNNHYYFAGLLQVQQTAQKVGYCYNKYVCWSGASVSDMHACRHKFT